MYKRYDPDKLLREPGEPVGQSAQITDRPAARGMVARERISTRGIERRSGLSDIPNAMLRMQARPIRGMSKINKDYRFDAPLSVALPRVQAPDLQTEPFDIPTAGAIPCAANAVTTVLQWSVPTGIRAVVKAYAWRTTAAGAPFLQFGLYIGGRLIAPGGRWVSDQPRTTQQFDPSASSTTNPDVFNDTSVPVDPNNTISIRVTNTDPVNAYNAWGRIKGYHWQEIPREDGRRSNFNTERREIF